MRFYYGNDGQQLFLVVLIGLLFVLKWSFRVIGYSPFLFVAYIATDHILLKRDHGLLWVGLILLFARILYVIFCLLRKWMISLKTKKNLWWIPLFMVCIVFSSLLPVWIVFSLVELLFYKLSPHSHPRFLALIFSLAAGYYFYKSHH